MESITLDMYINEWESFKMDWLFKVTMNEENKGVIESIVEKEGIGRYTTLIKFKITGSIIHRGSDIEVDPIISYSVQSSHTLIIDPETKVLRKNGLHMRTQEVKDILLKSSVFEDVYNDIPDDFLHPLSKAILDNHELEEPYETFQLAYLIDENTKLPPLKMSMTNLL